MDANVPPGAPDCSTDESSLLAQAKTLRAELTASFDLLLSTVGLSVADVARLRRRLERDPESRRALDAARREATTPATSEPASLIPSAHGPRNPRALRV
jgi:hypothetical protein